ncbi:MAG TPA: hypothetical protein HPP77_04370 [Candidatus Hydrogenedentes bacterium]|nr:hypothetical protein [Candidatus Hydrogenedentota bacterium]HIJ73276.1 hypothetical protein [Candidatus Hydrogenedentota bacterium]
MTKLTPDSPEAREMLRRYLLDTLSPAARNRVDERLAATPEWRNALEIERRALEALDQLDEGAPSKDLAAAVMARVREEEAERAAGAPPVRALVLRIAVFAAITVIIGALLVPIMFHAREEKRIATAAGNLKQLGVVFRMYANENKEFFPPLAPYEDVWMFDVQELYPKYLTDLTILVNPRLPNAEELRRELETLVAEESIDWERVTRIAAQSYTYMPWPVQNDEEAVAVAEARRKLDPSEYREPRIEEGEHTFRRIREGIERFFITDINNPAATNIGQSTIPVLFENVHEVRKREKRRDAVVLYMDGHVERKQYGDSPEGQFPLTEAVADAFAPQRD